MLPEGYIPQRSNRLRFLSVLAGLAIFTLPAGISSTIAPTQAQNGITGDYQRTLDQIEVYPYTGTTKVPSIHSKAFLLLDDQSSEIIVSKNATLSVPVASTTKMTTALVARSLYHMDDVLTVRSGPLAKGSKINLLKGEKITVENLLKGLLIQSGNDAAITLAEGLTDESGNTKSFIKQMNEFLAAHNLKNTTFADPAGLDDDNGRSTAFELAHIARIFLQDPALSDIVQISETVVTSLDGTISHTLKNSNRLIQTDSPYYLSGTLGIKTGFTNEAGHCLVSAYTINNHKIIGVVLNTNESTITASAQEMHELFDWASVHLDFRNY